MAVLIQNLNRALFCLILTPGNKISFLGSYQKALTRCCNDPLRPPRLSECVNRSLGGKSHIPIRPFHRTWPPSVAALSKRQRNMLVSLKKKQVYKSVLE
jgi:hypothetical protein